jgi:hypothetical protein
MTAAVTATILGEGLGRMEREADACQQPLTRPGRKDES